MVKNPTWNQQMRVNTLIIPEHILPEQFFSRRSLTPSQRLQLAILEEAIACIVVGKSAKTHEKQKLKTESEMWIQEEEYYFGSFSFVCRHLNLQVSYCRKKIAQYVAVTTNRKGRASLGIKRVWLDNGTRSAYRIAKNIQAKEWQKREYHYFDTKEAALNFQTLLQNSVA